MDNLELATLSKRGVGHTVQTNKSAPDTLIIRVALGVRLDKSKAKQVKSQTYVKIEADFLVLYEVKSKLSVAELKAFSQFNATHNVWPFWRQHVVDIVQRANLPKINIPLFSG
ncbi:hypothetical protein [Candidatus Spongiihabitans sp.]|uniref:hypothetical protein n=1 Tax=Candidatus Spongiihabitans sp. TaxID=3101308 RepID=UPI003C6F2E2F